MIRKRCAAFIALTIVFCWSVFPTAAEEVEVVVDSAELRLGDQIVGTVKRGARLEVVHREHPWICVRSRPDASAVKGWLLGNEVQTFVAPEIDEDSPAPPAFGEIRVSVNGTQNLVARPAPVLFTEVTITNDSMRAITYDESKIALVVNGFPQQPIPSGSPVELSGYPFVSMVDARGVVQAESVKQAARLSQGTVAPGESVSGWLAFLVPPAVRYARVAGSEASWELSFDFDGGRQTFDLLEAEVKAAGLRIRPSNHEPTVPVLEIGSRLNNINFTHVTKAMDELLAKGGGFVIVCSSPVCSVDTHVRYEFRAYGPRIASDRGRVVLVTTGSRHQRDLMSVLGNAVETAGSEEMATTMVLSSRSQGGDALIRQLAGSTAEARRSAATSLAEHFDQPASVAALIVAVADEEATVRLAALCSLAKGLGGLPGRWPEPLGPMPIAAGLERPLKMEADLLESVLRATEDADKRVKAAAVGLLYYCDDPRGEEAVLRGLADGDELVHQNAVRSAERYPTEPVVAALIKSLDDAESYPRDSNPTAAICGLLGRLKATEAATALTRLKERTNEFIAAAAIDALREIGELSPAEGALAKLEQRRLTAEDRKLLVESKDEAVVVALNRFVPGSSRSEVVEEALSIRADRGDKTVLRHLFETLWTASQYSPSVPLAVGRAGDPAGIAPLEAALQRQSTFDGRGRIRAALYMLGDEKTRAQLSDRFKRGVIDSEEQRTVAFLAEEMGGEIVPLVAPLLDNPACAFFVTPILWRSDSPELRTLLKEKLSDPLYRYSQTVVHSLTNPSAVNGTSQGGLQNEAELAAVIAFLDELKDVHNSETRKAVTVEMGKLAKELGAEQLARVRGAANGETTSVDSHSDDQEER